MTYIKKFLEWIKIKEKLDSSSPKPPLVKERDLWWISFGENVGVEISGKNELFSRPGLILKKISKSSFLVAPTTTQAKEGPWYFKITNQNRDMYICLNQIRTIDYRRFSNRLGAVSDTEFNMIKSSLYGLLK